MAQKANVAVIFILIITIVLAYLFLGGKSTGFFAVNDTIALEDNSSDLQFEQNLNQSSKEYEISCGGIPPVIHWVNATPNPATMGQAINFTAYVTDNYWIDTVLIKIGGVNYTMKKCTAGCDPDHHYYGISNEFYVNCHYDDHDGCWVEPDMWCYSWNATSAGNQTYTVCAEDWMGNWACKSGNFTVLSPALAIALSNDLAAGVDWNISALPVYNYSANGNNNTGITKYYVIVQAIGLNADLYVKADGNLTSNASYIPLANEKLSYNITNFTVPSTIKKSLTTNYTNNQIGYNITNSTKSWLKFFLDVPSGQQIGNYSNILTFKVVQTGNMP